jgi:hypothetical protein
LVYILLDENFRTNKKKVLIFFNFRFIKDNSLPITAIDNEEFMYYLKLYENQYQSLTKYTELLELIDKFGGKYIFFIKVRKFFFKMKKNS